jgi:hypothetical protein
MRPLDECAAAYNRANEAEIKTSRCCVNVLNGRISAAEKRAINALSDAELQKAKDEILSLNKELSKIEAVNPMKLTGADTTPEKLAEMMFTEKGSFSLISAEGGELFENIGRYSDKGGLEIYLKAYSGDAIRVDRKSGDSIAIDSPSLNIVAPCQSIVIEQLFRDKEKSGRGFLTRFLYVKCPTLAGGRSPDGKEIDDAVYGEYSKLVFTAINSEDKGELTLDADALAAYREFFNEIEPQLKPKIGELSFMSGWAEKLRGNMLRLAGLIHCVNCFNRGENPTGSQIDGEEAEASVKLAKFFLEHAKAVYVGQAEPERVTHAKYLWERIKSLNVPGITKSQICKATQNYRKSTFNLDESLSELVRRGYVRIETIYKGNANKPTTIIHTNSDAK